MTKTIRDVTTKHEAVIKELEHLRKRISNVEETIQLSGIALCIPSNWDQNCLNPARNCIKEWRAVVSFHGDSVAHHPSVDGSDQAVESMPEEKSCLHPSAECSKITALKVFGLLQLAMQCGPLSGSNAGYFKRCGGMAALRAHTFLIESVGGDVVQDLRFTENQHEAIRKWTVAAKKASEVNKPPSTSMLRLQKKAVAIKNSTRKN